MVGSRARRATTALIAVVMAFASAVASGGVAGAAEAEPFDASEIDGGGGPGVPAASVAPETQQARDKEKLAFAWAQEQGFSTDAARATVTTASYSVLLAEYRQKYGQAAAPPETVGATRSAQGIVAAAATSGSLAVSWMQQSKSYYCGPATGYMMLRYKGYTTSAYDGSWISQARLAGVNYMKTDQNGFTSTFSNNMNYGLNRWRSGSTSGYYVRNEVTSASELRTSFTYSVTIGEPLAVSTIEWEGKPHYNNHPNREIGHWVVGMGYSNSGDTIKMTDPASGLAGGYANAAKVFTATTTTFFTRHVKNRFNVW